MNCIDESVPHPDSFKFKLGQKIAHFGRKDPVDLFLGFSVKIFII